jgi:hypothetical protein
MVRRVNQIAYQLEEVGEPVFERETLKKHIAFKLWG